MPTVTLAHGEDFEGWRRAARALAMASVRPDEVVWRWDGGGEPSDLGEPAGTGFSVPRQFVELAQTVVRHASPDRFGRLYALLCRLKDQPRLIGDHLDSLVRTVEEMALEVRARDRGSGDAGAALAALKDEAAGCTRCHLYRRATQTVFSDGPVSARLMLVGEQPGDQEDLAGRPFVGPAGQLLDRALAAAGIDRARAYVTNAVKHFKFEPRGPRRIHQKPETTEIAACRWWLSQERALVRPAVTVALGATAAQALLSRTVTIGRTRGAPVTLEDGGECWVTVHPSFLLRIDDRDRAEAEFTRFVDDLKRARERAEALE